eukprot:COSAG01_NODE_8360_length_2817_cov_3.679176_4_plen_130_part_00
MALLQDLVNDLDRKISDQKRRMAETDAIAEATYGKNSDREEEVTVMAAKIDEINTAAEKAGEDGEVEQAMKLMEQAKELKASMDAVKDEIAKRAWHAALFPAPAALGRASLCFQCRLTPGVAAESRVSP